MVLGDDVFERSLCSDEAMNVGPHNEIRVPTRKGVFALPCYVIMGSGNSLEWPEQIFLVSGTWHSMHYCTTAAWIGAPPQILFQHPSLQLSNTFFISVFLSTHQRHCSFRRYENNGLSDVEKKTLDYLNSLILWIKELRTKEANALALSTCKHGEGGKAGECWESHFSNKYFTPYIKKASTWRRSLIMRLQLSANPEEGYLQISETVWYLWSHTCVHSHTHTKQTYCCKFVRLGSCSQAFKKLVVEEQSKSVTENLERQPDSEHQVKLWLPLTHFLFRRTRS